MNAENIINLLKRHFIENGRKDLRSFIGIILIIGFCSFCQAYGSTPKPFVGFIWVIITIVNASRIYGVLYPANRAMSYMMIPCSTTEKYFVNSILVFVYYNILFFVSITLGQWLGAIVHDLVWKTQIFNFTTLLSSHAPVIISVLLAMESIVMFGSVYFKKHVFWKILLSLWIISTVISILLYVLLVFNMPALVAFMNAKINDGTFVNCPSGIGYLFVFITFIFFNFMTWLRLRETEA
ncbi:MAG: hypothetical protein MJZ46_05480 [Bacteroidales bacterium]|nr:hypothetical protein [Bacteroidales bacterium]